MEHGCGGTRLAAGKHSIRTGEGKAGGGVAIRGVVLERAI